MKTFFQQCIGTEFHEDRLNFGKNLCFFHVAVFAYLSNMDVSKITFLAEEGPEVKNRKIQNGANFPPFFITFF